MVIASLGHFFLFVPLNSPFGKESNKRLDYNIRRIKLVFKLFYVSSSGD